MMGRVSKERVLHPCRRGRGDQVPLPPVETRPLATPLRRLPGSRNNDHRVHYARPNTAGAAELDAGDQTSSSPTWRNRLWQRQPVGGPTRADWPPRATRHRVRGRGGDRHRPSVRRGSSPGHMGRAGPRSRHTWRRGGPTPPSACRYPPRLGDTRPEATAVTASVRVFCPG